MNPVVRIVGALVLGVALDHLTGYARHLTAPLFVDLANSMLSSGPLLPGMILLNSSHAFVSGIVASVVGLLLLIFLFRIEVMFLPLVSCIVFAITTNWWFFSALPEIFEQVPADELLVALSGHTAAVIAWLTCSWILVNWMNPDKIYLWGRTLMLGREHEADKN